MIKRTNKNGIYTWEYNESRTSTMQLKLNMHDKTVYMFSYDQRDGGSILLSLDEWLRVEWGRLYNYTPLAQIPLVKTILKEMCEILGEKYASNVHYEEFFKRFK